MTLYKLNWMFWFKNPRIQAWTMSCESAIFVEYFFDVNNFWFKMTLRRASSYCTYSKCAQSCPQKFLAPILCLFGKGKENKSI